MWCRWLLRRLLLLLLQHGELSLKLNDAACFRIWPFWEQGSPREELGRRRRRVAVLEVALSLALGLDLLI